MSLSDSRYKIGLLFGFVCLLTFLIEKAKADPFGAYDNAAFVKPVVEQDGDTIGTAVITVSTTSATLISISTTTPNPGTNNTAGNPVLSNRRRTITNNCAFDVYIGSNTSTLVTTGFDLSPSTTAVTNVKSNYYQTYSNAEIYGLAASAAGSGGCAVDLIQETNSVP